MRCDRWTITKKTKNKDEVQKTAFNRNIPCSHSGCIQESSPVKKKKQKCTITSCSLESINFVIFVFLNDGIRLLVENMSTITKNVELGGILNLKNTVSACFFGGKRVKRSIQTYNFQLCLGDSADAVGSKVGVSGLDATQATQILIALLFPFGNQVLVCIAFLYTVIIQLCQRRQTKKSESDHVHLHTQQNQGQTLIKSRPIYIF